MIGKAHRLKPVPQIEEADFLNRARSALDKVPRPGRDRSRATSPIGRGFTGRVRNARDANAEVVYGAFLSTPICGIVLGMKRQQAQEIFVAQRDRSNALTRPKRINPRAAARFEVLDRFPAKAGMRIERRPIQFAQTAQCTNHLPQLVNLETKENILEFGSVEIEADTIFRRGHVCGRSLRVA